MKRFLIHPGIPVVLLLAVSAFGMQHPLQQHIRLAADANRQIIVENKIMLDSVSTGGVIMGSIRNLSDLGLEKAYVEAWSADSTTTDSLDSYMLHHWGRVLKDGTYQIRGMDQDEYIVYVWADGYKPMYYHNALTISEAVPVAVTANDTTFNIDFDMQKILPGTGGITGTITNEADGHPLKNAVVMVYNQRGTYYDKTRTDSDGAYSFNELRSDSFVVQVVKEGYISEYYDNTVNHWEAELVHVTEPNRTENINFQINKGGRISGRITDGDGNPVANTFVRAFLAAMDTLLLEGRFNKMPINTDIGWDESAVYTDSAGHYELIGLTAGDYIVEASLWRQWISMTVYYPGVTDYMEAETVSIAGEESVTDIDIQIDYQEPNGVIAGRVTDQNGSPIPEAYIYIETPWDSTADKNIHISAKAVTDRSGDYLVDHLPAGDYIVNLWYQGYWEYFNLFWPGVENYDEADRITLVTDNSERRDIDFALHLTQATGIIGGKVMDQHGNPLQWAYITMHRQESETDSMGRGRTIWLNAQTDSAGMYKLEHIPSGEYTVDCNYWQDGSRGIQWYDHKEVGDQATTIKVGDRTALMDINFDLNVRPMYGDLGGRVTDKAGNPISNAYIQLSPNYNEDMLMMSSFMIWSSQAVTDEDGRYLFENVYERDYNLVCYANGGYAWYPDVIVPEMSDPVHITGGEQAEADFKLTLNTAWKGSISGTIGRDTTWRWNPVVNDSSYSIGKASAAESQFYVVTAKPLITTLDYPGSERVFTAVTNTDGDYTLICPAGDYIVKAFSTNDIPTYYEKTYDPADAKTIHVTDQNPVMDINILLSPIYYWRYAVDDAYTAENVNNLKGKVQDESGNVVANSTVYLMDETGNAIFSTETDANGNFIITGLSGDFYVQASKAGVGSVYYGDVARLDQSSPVNMGESGEIVLTLSGTTSTPANPVQLPDHVKLAGNYPNPFNPATSIRFSLPHDMEVKLTIYNTVGQEIIILKQEDMEAGAHQIRWNGVNQAGKAVTSGLYFVRLDAGEKVFTQKMILMR